MRSYFVLPHLYSTEYSTVQYSTEYSTVQYSYSTVQPTPPAAAGSSAAAGTGWPGPEPRAPGGSSVISSDRMKY